MNMKMNIKYKKKAKRRKNKRKMSYVLPVHSTIVFAFSAPLHP